jgi:hypothetical protein
VNWKSHIYDLLLCLTLSVPASAKALKNHVTNGRRGINRRRYYQPKTKSRRDKTSITSGVLNINNGHNEKILEKCEILRGYATFIGQVRDNQKAGLSLQDAIASAIDFCVANDILVEYLENNGSEVHNMIFTEFNLEEAKEVWFEEGMEKGIDDTLLVINALMIQTPVDEIAAKYHMSVEQISRIRSTLTPGELHI